jgi:uncharacterized cysteine cluster protein YcgN (CxxCxxCC family)
MTSTADQAESDAPYWRRKSLEQMSSAEWEALCDGCAKCCLHRLEDEDTGVVYATNVACRLLDLDHCRCLDYGGRAQVVRDCVVLTPDTVRHAKWLPSTCAYRLLATGQGLPSWHPLVCGDPDAVHRSGHSVRGRVIDEADADDLEHHIVDWPL